jgi:tyrosine-protein kinase Etk/Wzc
MSEEIVIEKSNPATVSRDDEVHLLDLLVVLAEQKRMVIGTSVLFVILGVVVSLLMTPMFASTTRILPPQQQQSSTMSAMLGQLGNLAGAAGNLAGLKSPGDLYVGLLESRRMADTLIQRFKLTERYGATMENTRRALASNSEISTDKKDGMLVITVSDKDPQVAANMANAYAEELARLTQTMALTEASQRRMFFEKQLADVKEQLANAEIAMRTTQEKTGMIQPEAQMQAIIGNAARLKGAIAAKEIELNAMRTFATGQNPEIMRTQEELRTMKSQLAKLEQSQSTDRDFMVPTGKLPAVGIEYVRSMRDVKYYEVIFEMLAKQYELAKIDEAKDGPLIQVLDKAIPAEQKFKPKRSLIVLSLGFAGFVLGALLAFVRHSYARSRQHPEGRQRWERLSAALRKKPRGRASSV